MLGRKGGKGRRKVWKEGRSPLSEDRVRGLVWGVKEVGVRKVAVRSGQVVNYVVDVWVFDLE